MKTLSIMRNVTIYLKKKTNATKDWKSQEPFLSVSDHIPFK